MLREVTFPQHAWGIRPIRPHCTFQNDELCENVCVLEKQGKEEQE